MYEEIDEKELVKLCKRNDESAMTQLIEMYQDKLFALVSSKIYEKQDVEDVLQDIFIEIIKSLKRFKYKCSLTTWVYKIAHNIISKYIRDTKNIKDKTISIESYNEEEYLEIPDISFNPERGLEKEEIKEIIKEAVKSLPYEYKSALCLRIFDNLSYKEIADILHCSIGTVKSRLHNAKVIIGKLIKEKIK
jgi:RNA polymerase sigma-70 factor (ECF subfamily)